MADELLPVVGVRLVEGRTGSTLLMQLLATADAIVFDDELPGDRPIIGHGDLGPWNVLAIDALPVTFIDWDNAGPVDAVWELAQVAWLNAQLHDDDVAGLNGLPPASERVEFAIRSARDEALTYGVEPETTSPAPDGFPTLWGVTWRTRAAAWMLDHRAELTRAVC